jgi:ribonuclease E
MGERAPLPSAAAIARAEKLTRETFLHPGETKGEALAPGTPRRRALDAALAEAKQGLTIPSLEWRHEFSLLLGLERVLSEPEPLLADGTQLNPHQVDALSGTLTALLAQAASVAAAAPPTVAVETATVSSPSPASGSGGSDPDVDAPKVPARPAAAKPAPSKAASLTPATAEDEADEADGDEESVDAATDDLDDLDLASAEDDEMPAADLDDEGDDEFDFDDDDDPADGSDFDGDDDDDDSDDDDSDDDEEESEFEAEADAEEEADAEDLDEPEHDDEEPQDFTEDDTSLDHDAIVDGDDPGADRRFWFEHATGAGKTVAAMGFVEASRTGGVLILTHRRNLVDQFIDEIKTRGYSDRLCKPLLIGEDSSNGPVTVETYQWFVRNAGKISDAYTVVICDEAHTALGEKTSAQIRSWDKPIWIGMTATGALIARHVTDLFPTQTSRFDLAQAARRGVISPLRCIRIPPGPGVRTIAKVPLRRGEVDTEFDQEMLAELLDQTPFNLAIADLYKTRFNGMPGVVYAAGVKHAYNVAASFRALDMKAMAVSGETPKRELAKILADYEAGKIDVLVNAQLLAEGWNSPRATVCMHLAPTASKRIYQQRVGRVTRRHPGKEAGIVIDFVHPATKHDDPVVTLHSLLDRDVYRGGAIVIGPVRRGRGRRIRVERRVLPVTPDPTRRAEVFERELWRIAVENLDYAEQPVWAALAGARVQPNGWRRAKAMLHFDQQGELRSKFLIYTLQRNRSAQLRLRAIQEIAAGKDADAFDTAIDLMGTWPRDERREAVKVMLLALAERRIGRRDQANAWIWRMAEYTRDVHEEYAAQRWPETKRLLGLLVNSSGSAHARNARRLVHATRAQDRRLSAALLAAALAHTPEAEEALRGARTRMARKPAALARELLRNFPKGKKSSSSKRRRRSKTANGDAPVGATAGAKTGAETAVIDGSTELERTELATTTTGSGSGSGGSATRRSRSGNRRNRSAGRPDDSTPESQGSTATHDGSTAQNGERSNAGEHPRTSEDDAAVTAAIAEQAGALAAVKKRSRPGRRRGAMRPVSPPAGEAPTAAETPAAATTPAAPETLKAALPADTPSAEAPAPEATPTPAAKAPVKRTPAKRAPAAKAPAAKSRATKAPAAKAPAAKAPAAKAPAAKAPAAKARAAKRPTTARTAAATTARKTPSRAKAEPDVPAAEPTEPERDAA